MWMTSHSILDLYIEVSRIKKVNLGELVEARLDLLLANYEEDLQKSYDSIRKYDALEIIKEINKDA